MYDYIDNNLSLKRTWLRQRRLHSERIRDIRSRHSERIGNDCPQYHDNAPCKHKKRELSGDKATLVHLLNGVVLRSSLQSKATSNSLLNVPHRRRNNSEIKKQNISMCRNLVGIKSNYSVNQWEKDYLVSRQFKKLRSKPHVFEKRPKTSLTSRRSPQCMESYIY